MFEHWKQVAYFDNEHSVFPSDDLLDSLKLFENPTRRIVSKALSDFGDDFNHFLLEADLYERFRYLGYQYVFLKNESVLFC